MALQKVDSQRVIELVAEGKTHRAIASELGIHHSRVSAIVKTKAPELLGLRAKRRVETEFQEAAARATVCPVCGYWVFPKTDVKPRRTCGEKECVEIYKLIRETVNQEEWLRGRTKKALWVLQSGETRRRDWAIRVLVAGEREKPGKRFFWPGSKRRRAAWAMGLLPWMKEEQRYLFP